MTSYNKPHLTYQEHKNRGLIVNNEPFAIIKLQHISYYRLSAYFLPFQSPKETSRSKETFVKHFRDNYTDDNLPLWMVVEIISFGTLSKLYTMLSPQTKKEILTGINLPSLVFKNWLHVFSYVRNLSAHHSRLWNRQFVIKAKIPKHKKEFTGVVNDKYHTFAVMVHYVLNAINDTFEFKTKLNTLLDKYPQVDRKAMKFVDGWEELEVWR